MAMVNCSSCNTEIDESTAVFGDDGMICMNCEADLQVAASFKKGFWASAWAAMGIVGLSFLIPNVFGILSIAAIAAGVRTFRYRQSLDPENQSSLDGMKGPLVVAGVAIAFGVLTGMAAFGIL